MKKLVIRATYKYKPESADQVPLDEVVRVLTENGFHVEVRYEIEPNIIKREP